MSRILFNVASLIRTFVMRSSGLSLFLVVVSATFIPLSRFAVLTLEVFTRSYFGRNYLAPMGIITPFPLLCAFLVVSIFGAWGSPVGLPINIPELGFIAAYIGMWVYRYIEAGKYPESRKNLYSGNPYEIWNFLSVPEPGVKVFVEPVFIYATGHVVGYASWIVGRYMQFAAWMMLITGIYEYIRFRFGAGNSPFYGRYVGGNFFDLSRGIAGYAAISEPLPVRLSSKQIIDRLDPKLLELMSVPTEEG